MEMPKDNAAENWFKFVEDYNKLSTVPLSWMMLGSGEVTGIRMVGTPAGMTTLSKREWKKISEDAK